MLRVTPDDHPPLPTEEQIVSAEKAGRRRKILQAIAFAAGAAGLVWLVDRQRPR